MGILGQFKKKISLSKKSEKAETGRIEVKKEEIKKEEKNKYTSLKPKVEKEVKTKKVKKEETKEAYRILVKPLITEKATNLVTQNKYSFWVAKSANKIEVKKAIKNLYGVEPISVNIINMRGKFVRYGRTFGKKKNWKKAIITLKPGEKIEIYEGV